MIFFDLEFTKNTTDEILKFFVKDYKIKRLNIVTNL